MRRSSLRWLIALTLVVSLSSSCSNPNDEAADTTLAPTTTTATTTTTGPTTTVVPTTAVSVEPTPGPVFSWSRDDLGEWVTEDEMTDALKDVVRRHTDSDLEGEAVLVPKTGGVDDWVWVLGLWTVLAHDGHHDARYDGPPLGTDPRLPPGVTYEALSGFAWGYYVLSGPDSDELICLSVIPHGKFGSYPAQTEVEAHRDIVFGVASMMLNEMAWAE